MAQKFKTEVLPNDCQNDNEGEIPQKQAILPPCQSFQD
jgi:hypothetical protein